MHYNRYPVQHHCHGCIHCQWWSVPETNPWRLQPGILLGWRGSCCPGPSGCDGFESIRTVSKFHHEYCIDRPVGLSLSGGVLFMARWTSYNTSLQNSLEDCDWEYISPTSTTVEAGETRGSDRTNSDDELPERGVAGFCKPSAACSLLGSREVQSISSSHSLAFFFGGKNASSRWQLTAALFLSLSFCSCRPIFRLLICGTTETAASTITNTCVHTPTPLLLLETTLLDHKHVRFRKPTLFRNFPNHLQSNQYHTRSQQQSYLLGWTT